MAENKYTLDERNFSIRKAGRDISRAVWKAVKFVLTVLSLTIVGYVVFALVYSTDEEKRLKSLISSYETLYPALPQKVDEIGPDLERLSRKDDIIYKDIFHSEPPADDPMSTLDIFFGSDSIPDAKLVFYTADKAEKLVAEAAEVDSLFRKIVGALKADGFVMPPMALPLDSISYTQTGAGTGTKINPFYTTTAQHNGVDFIVAQGTPVKAAGDGVVGTVQTSRKGEGNTVTIKHKGGYRTRYSHLQDIRVAPGQSVRKGSVIATAGMSGNSYAPHLHYEVWRDSLLMDPLSFIFASVSPEEYSNMVYVAQHTKQTMD
ncbi:MAG: M23 family metallopeptidase [Bacteroidales bacterium]|nr:M23 family metallopeptidase [Bacteroidales bacterium]